MTATTLPDLHSLSTAQLLQRFAALDAPRIEEMHGEYNATLLQQPNIVASLTGRLLADNPLMPWLGKAFRPVDAGSGRGYNFFRLRGEVVQRFPMHTCIAPSRFDRRPSFHLIYRAYESACGDIHMVDELRRLVPGLYLGLGTWGFIAAQRRIPLPFLLEGPAGEYRGDIGTPRRGFRIGRREIPALG